MMMMMKKRDHLVAHPPLFIQTHRLHQPTAPRRRIFPPTAWWLEASKPQTTTPANTLGRKFRSVGNISRLFRVCYGDGVTLGQDHADGGVPWRPWYRLSSSASSQIWSWLGRMRRHIDFVAPGGICVRIPIWKVTWRDGGVMIESL
jgi:hypothetical protein